MSTSKVYVMLSRGPFGDLGQWNIVHSPWIDLPVGTFVAVAINRGSRKLVVASFDGRNLYAWVDAAMISPLDLSRLIIPEPELSIAN